MLVQLAAVLLIIVGIRAIVLGVVDIGLGVPRLTGWSARVVGGIAIVFALLFVFPAIGWLLLALRGGG